MTIKTDNFLPQLLRQIAVKPSFAASAKVLDTVDKAIPGDYLETRRALSILSPPRCPDYRQHRSKLLADIGGDVGLSIIPDEERLNLRKLGGAVSL